MEPIRRRPQDITPGRPLSARPNMPAGQRPVFSDFTSRPQARPAANAVTRPLQSPVPTAPAMPVKTVHQPAVAHTQSVHPQASALKPVAAQATPNTPQISHTSSPQARPHHTPTASRQPAPHPTHNPAAPAKSHPARPFAAPAKTQEHKSRPKRSGLVGFICFIALGGLLASPFLPGKTFDSFPGSSQSSSSGDDSLACIHELGEVSTSLSYNHKLGSPITYSYATTTTQKATCDGKQQAAVAGRAGQFNPLGLLIDLTLALALSIVVSKIWRRVFHEQE